MNKELRARVVKAMDLLVCCVNCESYIDSWLMFGVADASINMDTPIEEIAEMSYVEDEDFKELMTLFLKTMDRASKNGGLFCDGIVSGEKHIEWR